MSKLFLTAVTTRFLLSPGKIWHRDLEILPALIIWDFKPVKYFNTQHFKMGKGFQKSRRRPNTALEAYAF